MVCCAAPNRAPTDGLNAKYDVVVPLLGLMHIVVADGDGQSLIDDGYSPVSTRNSSIFFAIPLLSDWAAASIALFCKPLNVMMLIAASTAITTITISSSTIVKPRLVEAAIFWATLPVEVIRARSEWFTLLPFNHMQHLSTMRSREYASLSRWILIFVISTREMSRTFVSSIPSKISTTRMDILLGGPGET